MTQETELMDTPRKYPVVGVGISTTSYQEVLSFVRQWLSAHRPDAPGRYICVTTANGIITAHKDRGFKEVLNEADIVTPDGMPLVWALRSFGFKAQARVYGPNLTLALCEQAAYEGHRIFFLGGRPEVLAKLRDRLQARLPDLQIAGAYSPPFGVISAEEDEAQMRMIRESGAQLVFVGLGEPKQERWMSAHRNRLPGVVLVGVGAAFDFHAGTLRQAPVWMQSAGLEWFFRLAMEPRRLWRRYILTTPRFLPLWAMQRVGLLRYPCQR
jgi:N-acetylglucosaminyldiphosphoundecaprenol N-acetyl-beta-D-mannosaminyltransferase